MKKLGGDTKPECKYGEACYQKNQEHLKRFKHSFKDKEIKEQDKEPSSPPRKKLKPENECPSTDNKECAPPPSSVETSTCESVEEKNDIGNDVPVAGDTDDEEICFDASQTSKDSIKQRFLVDMPQDFYDFWDFCKEICEEHPENALADIGLKLVGAFDLLSNKFKDVPKPLLGQFLCHWRFYYDPPELQTVLVGDENEFHIGYFRDDPAEDPVFLASMSSLKPGIIQPLKEDLFSTVFSFAKSSSCTAKDKAKKEKLLDQLKSFSDRKKYSLSETSARFKGRKKRVVAKPFHGAGIVVPVDEETDVGYREIPETNADLKRIMKKIDEAPSEEKKQDHFEVLQELLTNAQWATDEGDFGMGLELGLDLFTYGSKDFHKSILHLLPVAYKLLDREPFSKIIKAHLRNRRRGPNMSSFETDESSL